MGPVLKRLIALETTAQMNPRTVLLSEKSLRCLSLDVSSGRNLGKGGEVVERPWGEKGEGSVSALLSGEPAFVFCCCHDTFRDLKQPTLSSFQSCGPEI